MPKDSLPESAGLSIVGQRIPREEVISPFLVEARDSAADPFQDHGRMLLFLVADAIYRT
jgi:hypothetical protein